MTPEKFLQKYKYLYTYDRKTDDYHEDEYLIANELFYLQHFCSGEQKVLNFSNHYGPWMVHCFNATDDTEDNFDIKNELLQLLVKKIGTEGGNNYDIINAQEKQRTL